MSRVLFLTESFHPVLGGGEGHIRALGRALAAAGHVVTVVTRRGDPAWAREEMLEGIRVVRVGPSGPGRTGKYRMLPRAAAALVRERASYDVLVVRGTRVLGLPGLVVGRALGKAVVLQAEINGEMSGTAYTWGTRFEGGLVARLVRGATSVRNLWMRDADAFVAMSQAIRREFEAAGVAKEKIAHLPHGVDTTRFRPAGAGERVLLRQALGRRESDVVFCYTGRLLRGKGLETLLSAFAVVASESPEAHLLVVGSGEGQALSIEDALRDEARREGLLGRVTFAGRRDDVEDCLRASDAFVFPSRNEALGISLVEAASCGLPAVASRTGGIVDVVREGATGLLVEPGDVAGLAAGMRSLLRDPEGRRAYGAAAREDAVGRFGFEASVARYRTLFAEVAR